MHYILPDVSLKSCFLYCFYSLYLGYNLNSTIMFTGNEDQRITLADGGQMTRNYRNASGGGGVLILGHYFGKKILTDILAQENCVGIRTYYALSESGEKELVIVGVDKEENDLVQGIIGDRTYRCPPHCGDGNALNS
ncbi:MAG: hypothetical protein Q8L81_16630 [Bacteroidota bacterium]|nr:hypothetical protein [Bacteroidota bacterium]